MTTRKHALATAVALATALAAGSALAIAESNDNLLDRSATGQSATVQSDDASRSQTMDSSQSLGAPPASEDSDSFSARSDEDDSGASGMRPEDTDNDSMTRSDEETAAAASDSDDATSQHTGAAVAVVPSPGPVVATEPAYIAPPDSPRYTPETGNAEYGSKLEPVGPQSNRFNDATGQ